RARPGRQDITLARRRDLDRLLLMAVEAERRAEPGGVLAAAEDPAALLREHSAGHQHFYGLARLERGIELDERVGPEASLPELLLHVAGGPRILDLDKAADVVVILLDHLIAQPEDVHSPHLARVVERLVSR